MGTRIELDPDVAERVWTILVEECEASEKDRLAFVANQSTDHLYEWRFIGALGFGGKFWRNVGNRNGEWGEVWYVSCYPEDENDARRTMIERANKRLGALLDEVLTTAER